MHHFSIKKIDDNRAIPQGETSTESTTHLIRRTDPPMPSALTLFPSDIPVAIRDDMPLCQLHQRAMWLREVIETYCSDGALDRLKDACPRDPDKFLKIRRYRERQLADTETRIAELESTHVYNTIMRALF